MTASVHGVYRAVAVGLGVGILGLLPAGCGAGGGTPSGQGSSAPESSGTASSSAAPSSTAPSSTAPSGDSGYETVAGLERCGPQPSTVQDQTFRRVTLDPPGRGRLGAVVSGHGRTVAVLLHQTDGYGFCGWLPFAPEAAAEPGVTVLAPDLCGYGEARCTAAYSSRQVDQVQLAVDYAERRLGARRIVLVGASMGGSLAVLTAAVDPRVAAAVDLSGPNAWADPLVSTAARDLSAPTLFAMAADEGDDEVDASRAAADAAPDGSVFLEPRSGHGYELLVSDDGGPTAVARRVLAWIRRG